MKFYPYEKRGGGAEKEGGGHSEGGGPQKALG